MLPTIGLARWRDKRSSEAAGWAMAAVFVTVMLTYFLAAWAKMRFGGWDWATGSTLTIEEQEWDGLVNRLDKDASLFGLSAPDAFVEIHLPERYEPRIFGVEVGELDDDDRARTRG